MNFSRTGRDFLANYKGNFGVTDGTRTHDDWNHNPGLYQLSYGHRRDQQLDLLNRNKIIATFLLRCQALFSLLRNISSLSCTIDAPHRHLARRTLAGQARSLPQAITQQRTTPPRLARKMHLHATARAPLRRHRYPPSAASDPTAHDAIRVPPAHRDTGPVHGA